MSHQIRFEAAPTGEEMFDKLSDYNLALVATIRRLRLLIVVLSVLALLSLLNLAWVVWRIIHP